MSRPSNHTKPGRPIELPGVLGDLARAVGGAEVLASTLRVSPRTIRDWAHSGSIPGPAQVLVDQLSATHLKGHP